MAAARSDETEIKKMWKILSTDGTMDNMRKDLHEDPKFKKWQETVNKEIQEIIEFDDTKSYENIFTEIGGLEIPNSTDCSDKLENLIKEVVDQNLCKFESQNEFIEKCIQYFG